jgi:hypothetical protein
VDLDLVKVEFARVKRAGRWRGGEGGMWSICRADPTYPQYSRMGTWIPSSSTPASPPRFRGMHSPPTGLCLPGPRGCPGSHRRHPACTDLALHDPQQLLLTLLSPPVPAPPPGAIPTPEVSQGRSGVPRPYMLSQWKRSKAPNCRVPGRSDCGMPVARRYVVPGSCPRSINLATHA